jgi:NTE family protein
METTALVLGAGGITGVAWQLGVIIGLRDQGTDLTTVDRVIGTSAGAVSGALVAGGVDPAKAVVMDAPLGPDDPPMHPDWERGREAWSLLGESAGADLRRRLGAIARAARVGSQEALLASFERRLPLTEWPARLVVTAVDAFTGEPVHWTAEDDVPIVPAVAASCAVPCLFPPITVNGRQFMDGGVRSRTNADLAAGHDRVVILAPRMPLALRDTFEDELAQLDAHPVLIEPDAASLEAIGDSVFAADRWQPVVEAAIEQGRRHRGEPAVAPG